LSLAEATPHTKSIVKQAPAPNIVVIALRIVYILLVKIVFRTCTTKAFALKSPSPMLGIIIVRLFLPLSQVLAAPEGTLDLLLFANKT